MKRWSKKIVGALVLMMLMVGLSGCSGDVDEVSNQAKSYVEQLFSGKWGDAIKQSSGEQLSLLVGIKEQLEAIQYRATIDRVEVRSATIQDEVAHVVVHMDRSVNIPEVGIIPDSRDLQLVMYYQNEKWYVSQMIELKKDVQIVN